MTATEVEYFQLPGEVTAVKRDALGDAWQQGKELALLHRDAITRLSDEAGPTPNPADEPALLLATHGWNVFVTSMGQIVNGQFDVASYLVRPPFDIGSLLLICSNSEERAVQFQNAKFRAGDARKDMVEFLREGEPQLGEDIDEILREDATATHELSHAGWIHFDKMVETRREGIHPVLGGRPDGEESMRLASVMLLLEVRLVRWLRLGRGELLPAFWHASCDRLEPQLLSWVRAVRDENQDD